MKQNKSTTSDAARFSSSTMLNTQAKTISNQTADLRNSATTKNKTIKTNIPNNNVNYIQEYLSYSNESNPSGLSSFMNGTKSSMAKPAISASTTISAATNNPQNYSATNNNKLSSTPGNSMNSSSSYSTYYHPISSNLVKNSVFSKKKNPFY